MEVKQKGEKRKCFWTLHLPSEKQRKSSVLEWIRKSSIWKNVSSSLYAEPAGFPTWATMCCQAECWSLEWLWLILFSIFTFFCLDLTLNFFLCFSGYSHLPKGTIYGKSAVLLDSLSWLLMDCWHSFGFSSLTRFCCFWTEPNPLPTRIICWINFNYIPIIYDLISYKLHCCVMYWVILLKEIVKFYKHQPLMKDQL